MVDIKWNGWSAAVTTSLPPTACCTHLQSLPCLTESQSLKKDFRSTEHNATQTALVRLILALIVLLHINPLLYYYPQMENHSGWLVLLFCQHGQTSYLMIYFCPSTKYDQTNISSTMETTFKSPIYFFLSFDWQDLHWTTERHYGNTSSKLQGLCFIHRHTMQCLLKLRKHKCCRIFSYLYIWYDHMRTCV